MKDRYGRHHLPSADKPLEWGIVTKKDLLSLVLQNL